MRSSSLLSLLLLVSICAAGPACAPQTDTPNNARVPVNSPTPAATTQTPTQTPMQTPTQTPLSTASPTATATVSPSASPSAKPTQMTYSVYKDAAGQWRWRLMAGNNRNVANSGEGYHNRQDCLAAIELIKNSKDTPVSEKP